jgi:pimeloyl-ACP methyl ester carboxylesterase
MKSEGYAPWYLPSLGGTVRCMTSGDSMTLPASLALTYSIGRVGHTFIGGSTLFPRDQIASYAAALNPIPARLLLERRNVAGSQLRVVDFSKFRGKPVLVLTGTNDLGHARAVDEPIADWLNANGAEADFIYLGDVGLTGNGHMLMLERNSDALAQLIIDWIEF